MTSGKSEEQRLYADLTRLITKLRNEPLASVEAVIEERFRAYLRAGGKERNKLEITLTWALPEGAESWPLYGTHYQLSAAESLVPDFQDVTIPAGATTAEIIQFPDGRQNACGISPDVDCDMAGEPARIFPFPKHEPAIRSRA